MSECSNSGEGGEGGLDREIELGEIGKCVSKNNNCRGASEVWWVRND